MLKMTMLVLLSCLIFIPFKRKIHVENYAGNCISKLVDFKSFWRSIRELLNNTSVILFSHQGTIVPASDSNPVCLGGKITVSMITYM